MMVNGLAPIIAPVIGGQILLFSEWRATFVLLTLIGVFLAGATLIYQETLPKNERNKNIMDSLKKFPALLHDRYFLGHCLLQCFVFGAFFSYLSGSSFIFQNIYAVSPQVYSIIFAVIGAGLLLTGALPARLAGRVPDIVMLKYAVLVPLIGSALLLLGFYFYAARRLYDASGWHCRRLYRDSDGNNHVGWARTGDFRFLSHDRGRSYVVKREAKTHDESIYLRYGRRHCRQ